MPSGLFLFQGVKTEFWSQAFVRLIRRGMENTKQMIRDAKAIIRVTNFFCRGFT